MDDSQWVEITVASNQILGSCIRVCAGWLRPRPIMGNRGTHFERTEIGRSSRKAIRDVWQNRAFIYSCRTWFESKIKILRLVQLLKAGDILRIEPAHIHEDVVVKQDAIPILSGCLAVLR